MNLEHHRIEQPGPLALGWPLAWLSSGAPCWSCEPEAGSYLGGCPHHNFLWSPGGSGTENAIEPSRTCPQHLLCKQRAATGAGRWLLPSTVCSSPSAWCPGYGLHKVWRQLSCLHCQRGGHLQGREWGWAGAKSGTVAESLVIRMGCVKPGQHQQPAFCSIASLDSTLQRWRHRLFLLPVNIGNPRGSPVFSLPALCLPL